MAELTPGSADHTVTIGPADPDIAAAIDAVAAAVENLAGEYAAAAPEAYTGTASFTVSLGRVDDEPETLTYPADDAGDTRRR